MDESAQLAGFAAAADGDVGGENVEGISGAERFLPNVFGRFSGKILLNWFTVDGDRLVGLLGFQEFDHRDSGFAAADGVNI